MALRSRHRSVEARVVASYYASPLPGLHCSTLVDEGPPRALVHDRFVLLTLTAGEAVVWCRGETHALSVGSVLMMEPGDIQRDVRKSPYRASMVVLRAELMEALRGGGRGLRLGAPVAQCATLCAETEALVQAVRAGHALAIQEQLTARLVERLAPFWTRTAPRPEPALVARARRALTGSGGVVSLEELARRLRCAPTYLCRVFSKHVGVGPHTYQLQQRLLEAGTLLSSGRSVASTAALTGFGDASHLRRHFRRRYAAAPSRYQRELAP